MSSRLQVTGSSLFLICVTAILLAGCSVDEWIASPPIATQSNGQDLRTPIKATGMSGVTPPAPSPSPTDQVPPLEVDFTSIPPGSYFVYFDWRSDTLHLLSQDEDQRDIPLVQQLATISPGLRKLAFVKNNRLVLIDLQTREVGVAALDMDCYQLPSWAPEGDRLAIECEERIHVYSSTSHSLSTLTDWGQRSVDAFHRPAWSPDGSWIAYSYLQLSSLESTPKNGIYIVEADCHADESNCQDQTRGPYLSYAMDPIKAWSPDSDQLAVFDDRNAIRSIDTASMESRTIVEQLEYINGLAWSPDGRWLAYSQDDDIYQVPTNGGEPTLAASDKGYLVSWLVKPRRMTGHLPRFSPSLTWARIEWIRSRFWDPGYPTLDFTPSLDELGFSHKVNALMTGASASPSGAGGMTGSMLPKASSSSAGYGSSRPTSQ